MSEQKNAQNTEIRYDCSAEELRRLGFVDVDGVMNNQKRYEYGLYRDECARRNKYRNMPELVATGIVDGTGKVLDEKRLLDYYNQQWQKDCAQFEAEQAAARIEAEKKRQQSIQKLKSFLGRWILGKTK